jgi:hypothetical protein
MLTVSVTHQKFTLFCCVVVSPTNTATIVVTRVFFSVSWTFSKSANTTLKFFGFFFSKNL